MFKTDEKSKLKGKCDFKQLNIDKGSFQDDAIGQNQNAV